MIKKTRTSIGLLAGVAPQLRKCGRKHNVFRNIKITSIEGRAPRKMEYKWTCIAVSVWLWGAK